MPGEDPEDDRGDGNNFEEDTKNGVELYRELKRLLPTAIIEHYHKHGVWDRELMLLDTELVEVHRREAGAPEPPPVVDLPELGKLEAKTPPRPWDPTPKQQQRQRQQPPSHFDSSSSHLTPVQPPEPPPSSVVEDARQEELRMIRKFVDRWRLDLSQTKRLFSRLRPFQRSWVMTRYEHTEKDTGPTTQLELFIKEAERKGWFPVSAVATRDAKRVRSSSPRRSHTRHCGSASSSRNPPRLRTPPRSPRPLRHQQKPLQGTLPHPDPSPWASSRSQTAPNNGARSGHDADKWSRTGGPPRPSRPPLSSAPRALATPRGTLAVEQFVAKSSSKAESMPGDLIKSLLFK